MLWLGSTSELLLPEFAVSARVLTICVCGDVPLPRRLRPRRAVAGEMRADVAAIGVCQW